MRASFARICKTHRPARVNVVRRPFSISSTSSLPRKRYGEDLNPWFMSEKALKELDDTIDALPGAPTRSERDAFDESLRDTLHLRPPPNREVPHRPLTNASTNLKRDGEAPVDQKVNPVKRTLNDSLEANLNKSSESLHPHELATLESTDEGPIPRENRERDAVDATIDEFVEGFPTDDSSGTGVKTQSTKPPRYLPPEQQAEFPAYRPWTLFSQDMTMSRKERLNRDLERLVDYLTITDAERHNRQLLAEQIKRQLQAKFPNVEFAFFGSLNTPLATYTSDIDIAFQVPFGQVKSEGRGPNQSVNNPAYRKVVRSTLARIENAIFKDDSFGRNHIIHKARYPLVTAQHKVSGISIDVVSSPPMHAASRMIAQLLQEYPQASKIHLILKAALLARPPLNGAKSGGIGSYTLTLMVIAAFRHMDMPTSKDTSLLDCLDRVLFFWTVFPTEEKCISIEPAKIFPKLASPFRGSQERKEEIQSDEMLFWQHRLGTRDKEQPTRPVIQDPADMTNDVGRLINKFPEAHIMFEKLSSTLILWMESADSDMPHPFEEFFGSSLGYVHARRNAFKQWCQNVDRHLEEMRARVDRPPPFLRIRKIPKDVPYVQSERERIAEDKTLSQSQKRTRSDGVEELESREPGHGTASEPISVKETKTKSTKVGNFDYDALKDFGISNG